MTIQIVQNTKYDDSKNQDSELQRDKPQEAVPMKDWQTVLRRERRSAEEERLTQWGERQGRENSHFGFKQIDDPDKGISLIPDVDLRYTTINDTSDKTWSTLSAAFGSASDKYLLEIFMQTINGCFKQKEKAAELAEATIDALLSMNPRDIIEGQLCSRLLMLTNQINTYMQRAAANNQTTELIDLNVNRATKLMRVYNETLEALNKHRRKGEQKVTVTHNHVNVNDGGKAIVGSEINQQPGGGDHDKK